MLMLLCSCGWFLVILMCWKGRKGGGRAESFKALSSRERFGHGQNIRISPLLNIGMLSKHCTCIFAILEFFSLYPDLGLCCVNRWGQFLRWMHVAMQELSQLFLCNQLFWNNKLLDVFSTFKRLNGKCCHGYHPLISNSVTYYYSFILYAGCFFSAFISVSDGW